MGDPGGVGSEVVAKALGRPEVAQALRPVIIGDISAMQAVGATARTFQIQVVAVSTIEEATLLPNGRIPILSPHAFEGFAVGRIDAANGRAAHAWIVEAARLALAGEVDAICTAPIAKEAMFAAGFTFPGHTELLAELCGGCDVRMMLEGGGLRVALETIHVALRDVPGLLSTERILATLHLIADWAGRHGLPEPRIGVCGLNPHAGEGGHFGREEIELIAPALEAARAAGLQVSGPHPADTVFHRARSGDFDLVLAMYHDQALIPVKTLDFHGGVNVTLGLPIIRTSPDHGTAFDLAGKGVANESSMVAALLRAAELARARRCVT